MRTATLNLTTATRLLLCCMAACLAETVQAAAQIEAPPDPGFEASVLNADAVIEVEILAGTPFRAVAQKIRAIQGDVPAVFELEGFNSYNWDTVHRGFATGSRQIVFLSRTDRPDVFSTLTPSAPRLGVQGDSVLLTFGDPPFRVPVPVKTADEMLAVLFAMKESGRSNERGTALIKDLWAKGEIEARYVAVALAGLLRDPSATTILLEASRDKLLKLRLFALESLGRVASPDALQALRAMLKDEKASVARESARILVEIQDLESLPLLLDWARKNGDPGASKTADPNRERTEAVAVSVLRLTFERAVFLDKALNPALLDIARGRNGTLARLALETFAATADAAEVNTLLELADDRTFELNAVAFNLIKRITLSPAEDITDFRAWWSKAEKGFNEDMKRDRVEAAAKTLARMTDRYEGRTLLETLRAAPGGIGAVSAAPLMLKTETQGFLTADELLGWNTPLAVPFLIERIARDGVSERRDALEALVRLGERHPRLRPLLAPYVLAGLSDEDSSFRRAAQSAVGRLSLAAGISGVLDGVQYAGNYEAQDASKAVYALTSRTLGFSINEPLADQTWARKRLRGWWKSAEKSFQSRTSLIPQADELRVFGKLDAAARGEALEKMMIAEDSRKVAAAFGILWRERDAANNVWKGLSDRTRHRDRGYGVLGQMNGDGAFADGLAKRAFTEGDGAEPMLVRALSLTVLASLRENGKAVGGERIVAWLQGAGAKAEAPWRRLAISLLGQCDGDAKSLAYLNEQLKDTLPKLAGNEADSAGLETTFAVLLACCARKDATAQLMSVLENAKNSRWREHAARELSSRRHAPALKGILAVIEDADRYTWPNLARAADPLITEKDLPTIAAMFESTHSPSRVAAGFLLQMHPEFVLDPATRGKMLKALEDVSGAVRYYATVAVGKHRSMAAVPRLKELLTDEDDEVRAAAAEALGVIGDKDACRAVAEALDMNRRIDSRWLRALAVTGDEDYLKVLLKYCNSNMYAEQRVGLEALGGSKHPLALATLLKIYRNDDLALQTVAGDTLSQRGGEAVDALKSDLDGTDAKARQRAIQLLGRIDHPRSRAELQRMATDGDPAMKKLAEFGLARLNAAPTPAK